MAPDSRAPETPTDSDAPSPSSTDTLRRLYASLLRCRRIQERLQASTNSAASGYELTIGHEAATVGATAELGAEDTIAACSRNLAALIARGAPLSALLSQRSSPIGMTCWSAPVLPRDPFHAGLGIALAHKLEQRRNVVVAFCAQRNPSLDSWRDALKFAAVHKLPIIFVIEGEAEPEKFASAGPSHLEAISFAVPEIEMPGIIVDGSDVVAVWRVAQESVHRARNGSGPTLIDCQTDTARDPLTHMEHYLRKRNAWDDAWRKKMESEMRTAIRQAVASTMTVKRSRSASGPRSSSPV